jgi:hypothetical protein
MRIFRVEWFSILWALWSPWIIGSLWVVRSSVGLGFRKCRIVWMSWVIRLPVVRAFGLIPVIGSLRIVGLSILGSLFFFRVIREPGIIWLLLVVRRDHSGWVVFSWLWFVARDQGDIVTWFSWMSWLVRSGRIGRGWFKITSLWLWFL